MIRAILRLVEWLDKRFPPRVKVTEAIFDSMQETQHRHSQRLAKDAGEIMVIKERVESLEKAVAALKDGFSKGQIPLSATERGRMRDSFITTGALDEAAS